MNSFTNTQLQLIITEESAKRMIQNYLIKSSAVKLLCKRKLLNLKMDENENPTDFYNNFEKLVNELNNAGEELTKKDKLNYFLLVLPASMSHIVDIVDPLSENENTVEYVKSKLALEFQKRQSTSENPRSNVFVSQKKKEEKKRLCYVCGGVEHIPYDFLTNKSSWNRGTRTPHRGGGRF